MAACVVVTGLVSALALSASVAGQPRRHVTIAAGAVDGVDYPIAGAMSRITSDARGLSVRATVESSAGSVANVQLIRSGEADFALLQNDIAYDAFNGIALGAFAGKPVKGMAGVFSVYPELVHIVVSPAAGVKSVRDLKGKRVAFGPAGSGSEQNALQILEIYGIGGGDLRAAVRVSFTAAVDQLKAGVVDAAFFTTALGAPGVAEAFGSGQLELLGVGPTACARAEVSLLHDRGDSGEHVQRPGARGCDRVGDGDARGALRPVRGSRVPVHQGEGDLQVDVGTAT